MSTLFSFSRLLQVLLWKKYKPREAFEMLFEMKFKVVEIRDGGVTFTHYLKGKRRDVKKDIDEFKQTAKRYEMVGKDGMVVWA